MLFAETFIAGWYPFETGCPAFVHLLHDNQLVVMVLVVAMNGAHSEIIDTSLLQELLAHKVLVTKLLNTIIVQTVFDHVTDALKITPATFDRKRVVEGKLLVDHPKRVICPHVIPTELSQFRDARVNVTVAHMTVRVDDSTVRDVAFHDGYDMIHGLVSDAIDDTDLGFSTKHAKHPAHGDVIAQALEPLVVDFTFIYLDLTW